MNGQLMLDPVSPTGTCVLVRNGGRRGRNVPRQRGHPLPQMRQANPVPPAPLPATGGGFLGREYLNCTIVAFDLHGSGTALKDADIADHIRAGMYGLIAPAFDDSRISWRKCHHEDRGDGLVVVVPPLVPVHRPIHPLVDYVHDGVGRHNRMASEAASIRLRMAVHAGPVRWDGHGLVGEAVVLAFRLLESAAFKRRFADSSAALGVVVSHSFFDTVIRYAPGRIDPTAYRPLRVTNKETRTRAWLYLPTPVEPSRTRTG